MRPATWGVAMEVPERESVAWKKARVIIGLHETGADSNEVDIRLYFRSQH